MQSKHHCTRGGKIMTVIDQNRKQSNVLITALLITKPGINWNYLDYFFWTDLVTKEAITLPHTDAYGACAFKCDLKDILFRALTCYEYNHLYQSVLHFPLSILLKLMQLWANTLCSYNIQKKEKLAASSSNTGASAPKQSAVGREMIIPPHTLFSTPVGMALNSLGMISTSHTEIPL